MKTRAQIMRDIINQYDGKKKDFASALAVTPRTLSRWLQQAELDDRLDFLKKASGRSGSQPSRQAVMLAKHIVNSA